VLLLEDEHGSEADSVLAASSNVDTNVAHGANESSRVLGVEGDEGALVLASEVLDVLGVLGSQASELVVEVVADTGSLLNQLLVQDLLDDSLAHDDTGRVADPGVELAVGLVGDEHLVTEEVTGSLGLLGEGDHVRGRGQVPVVVAPEGTSGTEASLDLIGDEAGTVSLGDVTETLEEGRGGVVVTTLGLDGLNDETGNGAVPRGDEALNLLEASLLLGGILLSVLLERVLEGREGSLGPVEAGDIKLVNGLGAGGGERAEATAVEGVAEAHDGELGGTGLGVLEAGVDLLIVPVNTLTTLAAAVEHEGSLVGQLVGLGARLSSEDVAEALGGNLHEAVAEDVNPLVGGEVAHGRSVDEGRGHLRGLGSLDQGLVVVANGDGGDLGVDIEVLVAVNIDNVVVVGLVVVNHEVDSTGVEDGIEALGAGLGDGTRDLRGDGGLGGLDEGRHLEGVDEDL